MQLLSPSAMSLCTLCLSLCPGAVDTILYAQSGHEATLRPTIHGQPENIFWTHDGNKVIQFDGSEEKVYSTYKNRIILDWGSGDLTIKDLTPEDSGQYRLEVNIQGKLHSFLQDLEVAKPTISCELNDASGSEPRAMLMCSVGTKNLSASTEFVWKLLEEQKPGQELPISLGGKNDDEEYCCVVSNPVSAKNATFTAKDCYPGKAVLSEGCRFII
uniref:Ig-like domain-containing protein n=1 Tax=Myripristis murdjan TaxID=586833 RepID=A0A668AKE0_9TELE